MRRERTFTYKGKTCKSRLSDLDCCNSLLKRRPENTFAMSIVKQWYKKSSLSEPQMYWLHRLAMDIEKPQKRESVFGDMKPLLEYFSTAKERLDYPKMYLMFDEDTTVKFYMSGSNSKYPNTVVVCEKGENGRYFGRIFADGQFFRGRGCSDEIFEWLKRITSNLHAEVLAFGVETGTCCFCFKELSDKRSKTSGYGKICADKWGLPWGA